MRPPRIQPPAAVVVSSTGSLAGRLNSGAAKTWSAARKMAIASRHPEEVDDDVDFNTLSASLQAIFAQARRRGVPDDRVALALGASCGPLLAGLDAMQRLDWVTRLSNVAHAAAAVSAIAVDAAAGSRMVH